MSIRIVRMPALDAALLRFDSWWQGLSRRERILVGTLGALLALAILVYGVIKPLQAARAEALQDIRTYETLRARIDAAGTLSAGPAPVQRTGPPATIVTDSATAFGLVANVEALPDGVRATIADGNYDAVIQWLADLGATSSLQLRSVRMTRAAASGRVTAVVEFAS